MYYIISVFLLALVLSCGKNAPEPKPEPKPEPPPIVLDFEVNGQYLIIKGRVLPDKGVTAEEAKNSLSNAVSIMEGMDLPVTTEARPESRQ